MEWDELIKHLTSCDCFLENEDDWGYPIYRNAKTGQMQGLDMRTQKPNPVTIRNVCIGIGAMCPDGMEAFPDLRDDKNLNSGSVGKSDA